MKLDRGYASPSSLTKRTKHVLNNPFVLIHENKMTNKNVLKQAIEQISFLKEYRRPLLIVAEDVEMDDVIEFLILDKTCLATQVVTGGFDVKLMPQVLGSCKELRLQLGSTKESPRCRGFGQDRDKKLGGASGVNLHKMNITLDNARIAVKAALEEGIVPGGGVALLHASKSDLLVKSTKQQGDYNQSEIGWWAVVFTDISLDKAIEFNGLCHHQGRIVNVDGENPHRSSPTAPDALLDKRFMLLEFEYIRGYEEPGLPCINVAEKLLTSGRNPVEHNFDSTHNDDIVAEEIDQMDESVAWISVSFSRKNDSTSDD
ncbi:hypothetical protein CUMW_031910 [Citrus unshiu]|nr:hypothetical protein CUMW_031910 [Citrus unshiu]